MYTLKTTHFTCRSLQAVLLFFLLFLHSANNWADSIQSDYGVIKIEVSPLTSFDYWGALYVDYELYISGNVAAGNTYKIDYYPTNGEHNYTASFYNNASASTPINSISANATALPPEPNAITDTTQGTQDGQVSLIWNNSVGATSYEVYRSSSQGALGDHLASLSGYSFVDTTIPSDAFHYYTIIPKAFNVWGPYTTQTVGWKKLSAPTSLSATQGSIVNSVGLSWTGVAYAEVYDVYRSASFGSIGSWIGQTSATNYTDTNSGYGTAYYYTVKPAHGGVAGNSSSQVTGWGKQPTPDQTTGVNATQGTLYAKVSISWSPANYANSYTIYRSTTSGDLGAQLASNIVGTSYDDTSVSGSTGYYYTVVSVNSTATGTNSAQVNGWGKVPAIVSNLTATQGTSIGKVTLNWASNPDATSYEVWRSPTSGGSYAYLTTVTPVTFDDITISGTTHYFYKVKVVVGTLIGGFSNEAEGWGKINYPAKVSTINATKGTLYGKTTVTWSSATDAATYNLYRSTTLGNKGALLASGLVNLNYDDATDSSNTHYFYTVVSVNSTGNGPDSDQTEGWGKVPAIVSNLTATQGTLSGKITLTWTIDPDATGYGIYRSLTSGGAATLIATAAGTASSYDDTSVLTSKAYYYTIKVNVGTVTGASSAEASGWRMLPVITTLTATQGTLTGKVRLTWNGEPEATSYEFYRSSTSGGAGILLATVSSSSTFYEDTTGSVTAYYYTMKVKVDSHEGNASNEATGWGKLPNSIADLNTTQGSLINKIMLSWTDDPEATGYEIYRSTTSGGATTLLATVTSAGYNDASITTSTPYYYTVKTKVGTLVGNPSNEASGWRKLPVISDLTATQGTLDGKVGLTWTPDSEATGYEIYRSTTLSGTITKIGTSTLSNFDDTTITTSNQYYYTIKVKVGANIGVSSNNASGYRKLPMVSDLSASQGTLTGKVQLYWTGDTEITSYEVWRSFVSGQAGSLISSGTASTYEDRTTGADTTYYYTIKAKVGALTGYAGNEAQGWGKLPNTISTLTATQGSLIGKVQLNWDFDSEAVSYEIWRSTTPGSDYKLLDSSLNAAYLDSTALDQTHYYYTVKIKTADITGNPSNEASGWSRLPNALSTLTATQGDLIAKVRLKWTFDREATGYEVWRAEASGGTATLLTTLPSSANSYDDAAIDPDQPYYYTIKVKVNPLVGPSSNEAPGFAKPIPPAPTINFKGGIAINAGKFYVPLGQKVTSLAPTSISAPTEKMKISITQNGETYERLGAVSGVFYAILAANLGLLEERAINVRVAWQDFPDVYNEQTITAIGGTKNNLKLMTDTPDSVADTEPVIVKLQLGEYTKNGIAYDPLTMGQWQAQLLVQTNSESTSSPGTEWIDMVNGKAEFSLNPAGNQFMKITAISRLNSTVDGLNVTLTSSTKYVPVVKGTPISGTISSKQFDAPAPKSFTLNLDMTPDNRVALKFASWEESSDNGATWDAIPNSTATRISVLMLDPDRKMIRAKMINKNTLVESYTDPVELLAYAKLTAFITGPRHAAPGTAAVLSVDVYKDGFRINDPIVEWTIGYSTGKQYLSGPTASVNESQEGKLIITIRARSQDTRPDDANAWAYSRYVVAFKNPGAPSLSVTGPRDVETGKTYHYEGVVRPSWGGVQSALDIVSEWQLPDDSTVAGTALDWVPGAQDLIDKKPLIFRAWVDGFKDTTTSEKTISYAPWEYIWPEFTISMKQLTVQAPSDLLLMVNYNQPSMGRRFEGLTYTWSFPDNVTGRQNDAFPNRANAQALFAGEYDITVTIQDARGHQTVLTQHIVAEKAVPYTVTLKVGKSNLFDRVPMKVTARSTIYGGHPLDKVTSQTWSIDGMPVTESVNRDYMISDITNTGEHVITYTINSKMGETATVNSPLSLISNQLPVCELKAVPNAYVVYADAKCTDPDGKVLGYAWEVNGQPIGATSYRISFGKTNTPQSATVTITAMDDAKELSMPVSITVSY